MLIAYLTTDDVNQDLALRLAEDCGETLCPLPPREAPDDSFDAVVYDLDFLPPSLRESVLAELSSGRPLRPAAVHGYNLDERQEEVLLKNGVAVFRRLDADVFQFLARAEQFIRAAADADRGRRADQAVPEPAA
jgi:hypothetical protein